MGAISIFKEPTERFFSDFGGLRIKESGLRLGDQIIVRPFNGNKYEVTLNRLSYRLKKGPHFKYTGDKSEIELPFISQVHTEYELILCGETPESIRDENGRFLLKATGLNPFKLNGNYTFEAYLEYGDVVELEYSRIEVFKDIKTEKKVELELHKRIVESKLSVLIEGETGTGKSRLARAIHEQSLQSGSFVHINISSFSSNLIESELFGHIKGAFTGAVNPKQGAFAQANRGTLFIDEIDSLPLGIQTKLLLFLDDHKVRPVGGERDLQLDVRLIFSSGKDLKGLVSEGSMRKDFFYRINTGGRIKLLPLRDETKKIQELLNEYEQKHGVFITSSLKKLYRSYSWPGNIRQLLGHLNRKYVLSAGGKIDFCDVDEELEENIFEEETIKCFKEIKSLDEMKKAYVNRVFEKLGKNIKKTARVLEVSPNTIRNIIRP